MLSNVLHASPDWLLLLEPSLLILDEVCDASVRGGHPSLVGRSLSELVEGLEPAHLEALLTGRHDPHPDVPLRVRVRTAHGETRPADIRATRLPDNRVLAVLRPLSERARIAERELVSVVCAAPAAIVTWSPEGIIRSFNPHAERLFHLKARDVLGQSIFSLLPESEQDELQARQDELRRGEPSPRREVVRLRPRKDADTGGTDTESFEAFDCEERLFVVRDVLNQVSSFGSVLFEAAEVVRLRRATEALGGRAGSASEKPARAGKKMREVEELLELAAENATATVLLTGETGVGKSHFARRIHQASARQAGAFIELNCASFDGALLEAELFGYERGAFTGAVQRKAGLVEAAAGGTLFLDEVGELPLAAQAKLLTFLDTGAFRRVGAVVSHRSDARILAATNADLAERVAQGTFRRDLFYRLRVLPIEVPPLRERTDELPELVAMLLGQLQPRALPLDEDVLPALLQYAWPGNVRELRNTLERACLLARGGPISKRHLPEEIRTPTLQAPSADAPNTEALDLWERQHVEKTLAAVGGNRSEAARRLGISRSTLTRKLAAWGSDPE